MTSRWFALLLCAFLAVPLCCCGWHGAGATLEAEAEAACPLCHAAEPAAPAKDDGCPCMKDLVQRDLAPRTVTVDQTAWSLALISEFTELSGPRWVLDANLFLARLFKPLPTGPPRLFLRHRALLC